MGQEKPKVYTAEFRGSAVKLANELSQPIAQTARDIGVNENAKRVAIFAKACFGHPSPSKRQKLNATANAFGCPDSSSVRHDAQLPSGTLCITAAQMT